MGDLISMYQAVRNRTEEICARLAIEDHVVQPHEDVSPPKWHLAHTTWFFEQLVILRHDSKKNPYDPDFLSSFNSYYESFGAPGERSQRAFQSRPTVAQVLSYRKAIDEQMLWLLTENLLSDELLHVTEVGIHHEQQHQELLCMDLKYILCHNPGNICYNPELMEARYSDPNPSWRNFSGGLVAFGKDEAQRGFAYDNEHPKHRQYLEPYSLKSALVNNQEYLSFIRDGGYRDFRHWLSDGWACVKENGWSAPLYWKQVDGEWFEYGFSGWQPLNPLAPVIHVSYFEAQAFANWSSARLATEAEWEHACFVSKGSQISGRFFEDSFAVVTQLQCENQQASEKAITRQKTKADSEIYSMLGDAWEWTQSAYQAYPGFKSKKGALNEYNAKFMSGQMVLRGGCLVTPKDHVRPTYRNFYYPHQRWQFSGIRLARD